MTQPYGAPDTPNIPPQTQYQPAPQQAAYPAPQPAYPAPQPYPPAQYGAPQASRFPLPYKDSTAAWLLWFFLGYFGAHHFYLGDNKRGTIYAVAAGVSFLLSFVLIGLIGYVVLFVFWIIDATQLSQKLNDYNARAYAHNQALGVA